MTSKSQYISQLYQNVPKEMMDLPRWVVHENKIPFTPMRKTPAKSNDENTWGTFADAVYTYLSNGYQGVGWCFKPPYVGVDIDGSVDLAIPKSLSSYTEYSPSGNGIHIICKGTLAAGIKTKGLEIYTSGRFFTVTGKRINEFPATLEERSDVLASLAPQKEQVTNTPGWIGKALADYAPGNIHNITIQIAGKLKREGWTKDDIRSLLLPHIQRVNGDIKAFEDRLTSIDHYKSKGQFTNDHEDERPVEIFTFSRNIGEYEQDIESRGKGMDVPLPTGYSQLDRITHGLKKGAIWVVGARTGIGKTSFSLNITSHLLGLGQRVLFFSTEMDSGQIFDGLISLELGLDRFGFGAKGWESAEDKRRYDDVRSVFIQSPIFICQEPEPTLRAVEKAISEVEPSVLVIDHIQRIASSSDKRYLEISRFVKGLNTLCRIHKVAGVVNSQLNRLAETEVPGLHHLRECGTLEEEAHTVLLFSKLGEDGDRVLIDVAKNRGPRGQVEMKFDKKTCRFSEV